MIVYQQLAEIARKHAGAGYLRAYAADLHTHDRNALDRAEPGQEFVWILRECGTELFAIASGLDPIWCTFWLKPGNYGSSVPPLTFHIRDGIVRPITADRARHLAQLPHPRGRKIALSLIRGETVTYPAST